MDDPTEKPHAHEIGERTYLIAAIAPPDGDGSRTVLAGAALWLLGLIVLAVFFLDRLHRDDHVWWLATCAVGTVLGLAGAWWCRHRASRSKPGSPPNPDD